MKSTPKQILRQLAQSGNAAAIATLLNQVFQPHQVIVKAIIIDNCLKITLVTENILEKELLIFLLISEISQLPSIPVETIKVHCHQKIRNFNAQEYNVTTAYNIWTHEQKILTNQAEKEQKQEADQNIKTINDQLKDI